MKKWLFVPAGLALLFLASIYIFIPATLQVSGITTFNSPKNAVGRFLLDAGGWRKWWPVKNPDVSKNSRMFYYNGYEYKITALFTDRINLLVIHGNDTVPASVYLLPLDNNKVTLEWRGSISTGFNPVTKVLHYNTGRGLKKNMTIVLKTLQVFLEETGNVYGFPISEVISTDSTLIATKYLSVFYPKTTEIYSLIDSIKTYIKQQGGVETNHPMLRIEKLNDTTFQTMVAIPTNRVLPGRGSLFFQRFVPYKTLVGRVKGDAQTVDNAFRQMETFVEDHQRTSMAVPFQSLVTDRSIETDPGKWITLICQPVS
jgi:hypothetical protein